MRNMILLMIMAALAGCSKAPAKKVVSRHHWDIKTEEVQLRMQKRATESFNIIGNEELTWGGKRKFKKLIPSFYVKQNNLVNCGPASVAMVMRKKTGKHTTVRDVRKVMGGRWITTFKQLKGYLTGKGIKTQYGKIKGEGMGIYLSHGHFKVVVVEHGKAMTYDPLFGIYNAGNIPNNYLVIN